jgi:DDE superfamily endonuclease
MSILPPEAEALALARAPVFTEPTWRRFLLLLAAAILTTGRRTIANLLRTVGALANGHKTSYQRVLSAAPWSGVRLACALARLVIRRCWPAGRITPVGDDTVESHPGRKVYGKARHRDPVRSSKSYTAGRYGHKGASWLSWFVCRSPHAPGPCRCWWTCTAPSRTIQRVTIRIGRRRNSCAGSYA